ncbi:MAG: serine/threonine-protein kinase [Woeseiaceae bacterium]
MTQPDPKLVDEIFSHALEMNLDARFRYVDERCRGDEDLRRVVRALIEAADSPADILGGRLGGIRDRLLQSVLGSEPDPEDSGEDLSGKRIGAWRLQKRLARGGLATVYLAHRDDGEYDQRVAFKVLRRGLDTDDLVARFRVERQILSALDHPSIASILDGGALDDGRPYLVLEFVDGEPITTYCKTRGLSVRDRITTFLDVLHALHHAHKHLIVHRDIKPSNILVSKDGDVSLLDFGIAKLLDPGAVPGASTLTRTGMSLLTPGYCSPEQQAGEPVTTASDVYQAGAVLYELLTGSRPRAVTASAGAPALPAPSQTLKGTPDYADVRGDLDAIVRKALHADPTQRYTSAAEMAADIERHLDGRPVIARPDTLRYRLQKFAKRHPWAIPIATIAALAIIIYVVTLTTYNERLRVQQRRASAAQQFMVDFLRSPNPFRPADAELGRRITVVEALDIGVERLKTELQDDPVLRASLLAAIASVYASLDAHSQAIELETEALALQTSIFGEPSEEVLDSLKLLATQYFGLSDYEHATEYFDRQLEMARQLYPENHPKVGEAEIESANLAVSVGDTEGATRLYRDGIRKVRPEPGEYSKSLIDGLVGLAYVRTGEDFDESMALLAEAEAVSRAQPDPDELSMALIHAQAATTLSGHRDYAAAEKRFRAALQIYEARIGRDHSATLSTLNNLGVMYLRADDFARAESVFREVLDRYTRKYGSQHHLVAASYQNLATAISRQERYAESMPLHRKAFEIYAAVMPTSSFEPALPLLTLAYAQLQLQEYADAEVSATQATAMLENSAPDTYIFAVAQCLAGLAIRSQGRADEGQALLDKSRPLILGSDVSNNYYAACISGEQ